MYANDPIYRADAVRSRNNDDETVDPMVLAQKIQKMCNEFAQSGYEIVSVFPVVETVYARLDVSRTFTKGAVVIGKRALTQG